MRPFGKTYWRRRRNRLVKMHVTLEGKMLDIGCGWRVFCQNAIRLDINPDYKPDAVADIEAGVCFKDGIFDTVLMFDVLEHLEHPHQALEEVKRVLRRGGTLYITVPFCFPRHGVEYFRFSDLALKKMLGDFEVNVIPVKKSKLWNLIWNTYWQDTIIEGYFVKAIKK